MAERKMVPPDGGWGWMVVFAMALSNVFYIPIIQSFGLLFRDAFEQLNFSAADTSIILNVNTSFSMLTGLFHGALLKYFGYRKTAIGGSTLTTVGVIATSFATSFSQFMFFYGIITSFGMGLIMSSFSLAVNSYFRAKRGRAISIGMTITGLGPILMPQLISFLLSIHTTQGATLIIGALTGHTLVAACLLQPVKWHLKEEVVEEELVPMDEDKNEEKPVDDTLEESKDVVKMVIPRTLSFVETDRVSKRRRSTSRKNSIVDSTHSIDHDREMGSIYGLDTPLHGSILSLGPHHRRRYSSRQQTISRWWSTPSVQTINLQSSVDIFNDSNHSKPNKAEVKQEVVKEKTCLQRIWWTVVNFFDLTLLLDPIYVNIMLGMSLAIFAELTFSVLTPFILADFGLNTAQSAMFLSLLSGADIIFRFCAPYIGEFFKKPPRVMYMVTLSLLIASRFSLLLFSGYYELLGVALGLGIAKGIRTVYMSLVIPSYVPIERLASAAGIQMMVNGICILIGGPILGVIRDVTGSYRMCIVIMNLVTLSCIMLWTTEMIYVKFKKKK